MLTPDNSDRALYAAAMRVLVAVNEGRHPEQSDVEELERLDGPIPCESPIGVHVAEILRILKQGALSCSAADASRSRAGHRR